MASRAMASEAKAPEMTMSKATDGWILELQAKVGGERVASVTLGTDPSLEKQETYRAPPGHFSETALYATGKGGSPKFARQIMPAGPSSFSLLLEGTPGSDVRLVATGLSRLDAHYPVLTEKKTGETHDLRADPSMTVSLPEDEQEASLLLRVAAK